MNERMNMTTGMVLFVAPYANTFIDAYLIDVF